MVNIPPIPPNAQVRTEVIPDVTKIWKVGQVLDAITARNANPNDTVLMRMGQTLLEARTPIALKAGDPLKLLVKSVGDTPVLTIQGGNPAPQVAAQNLKHFIARQQDMTGLLAAGRHLVASPEIQGKLNQQLVELLRQMPDAGQAAQPKVLKKLLIDSGIFLESKLSSQQTRSLGQDVKSQLLRISSQLQEEAPGLLARPQAATNNSLLSVINAFLQADLDLLQLSVQLANQLSKGELQTVLRVLSSGDVTPLPEKFLESFTRLLNYLEQQANPRNLRERLAGLLETMGLLQELKAGTDGALAKITSQQLTPLTRDAENLLLLFDLYIRDGDDYDLVNFRLEQEKSANDRGPSGWMITLNFDFMELGPVQAHLHLLENRIHTTFRAEKESTAEHLSRRISLLEDAFGDIGFDAVSLAVSTGSISQPNDLADGIQLLDEQA